MLVHLKVLERMPACFSRLIALLTFPFQLLLALTLPTQLAFFSPSKLTFFFPSQQAHFSLTLLAFTLLTR